MMLLNDLYFIPYTPYISITYLITFVKNKVYKITDTYMYKISVAESAHFK